MKNDANWYTPSVEHQMAVARLSEFAWARPGIRWGSLAWGTVATVACLAALYLFWIVTP